MNSRTSREEQKRVLPRRAFFQCDSGETLPVSVIRNISLYILDIDPNLLATARLGLRRWLMGHQC